MQLQIIIDGYNLIFEIGLHGKRVDSQSLKRAREKLLTDIASGIAADQLPGVGVVFDANRQPLSGQQERELLHGIAVLYSIHYDEADTMIEELIRQNSAPRKLTVVSSDHRLHKAARRRRATAIDSGTWYDDLLAGKLQIQNVPSKTDPGSESSESGASKQDLLLSDAEIDSFIAEVSRENLVDDSDQWP